MSHREKAHANFISSIVSGSSPDLVSGGNFYLKHYRQLYPNHHPHPIHRSQSYLPPQHGTYENLASIFNNNMLARPQAVIVEDPNITKHIKKYWFVVTCNQNALVAHDPHLNNSTEPIYENIPFPWQTEGEMRARTQSIHSAPEISQVVNHTVVNAVQSQLQQLKLSSRQVVIIPWNYNLEMSLLQEENLYANIDHGNVSVKSSKTEINNLNTHNNHNTSTHNLSDTSSILNRSAQSINLNTPSNMVTSTPPPPPHSSSNDMTSTIMLNKNLSTNTTTNSTSSFVETSNTTSDSYGNSSSTSNINSSKSKRKGGVFLIGRGKTSEKVKSATLGREKKKEDKNQSNNKHRWSTGLPRFNPLPPAISKETMCQLLENKLADSQLFFEFDKIPKKKQNADFTTALLPENQIFNRFKDVLPYEDNRLRLMPTKHNKFGYINASHITATVGSKQRFYIAAQGPTRQTLPYFWQCVWEAEVYLMVQLTDLTEDMIYLPDADERCIDIDQLSSMVGVFPENWTLCHQQNKVMSCRVTQV
ncbi:hypothetical protein NQ317_018363 [Molorchus minor]|uniref:Tyrosine-protein phosphatase domain-containing protein n=1 Tax=Molorchus minor TaxID=1323400 RepID=A0ABQ9JHS3_9CUCU|nr:hypothetical protein NQ317_018363 [Molorchus minor]